MFENNTLILRGGMDVESLGKIRHTVESIWIIC